MGSVYILVCPESDDGRYPNGTEITLTAMVDTDQQFQQLRC